MNPVRSASARMTSAARYQKYLGLINKACGMQRHCCKIRNEGEDIDLEIQWRWSLLDGNSGPVTNVHLLVSDVRSRFDSFQPIWVGEGLRIAYYHPNMILTRLSQGVSFRLIFCNINGFRYYPRPTPARPGFLLRETRLETKEWSIYEVLRKLGSGVYSSIWLIFDSKPEPE